MTRDASSRPDARSPQPADGGGGRAVGAPTGSWVPRVRGERLLLAAEVADLLAVPVTWVREATRAGRLPHVRLGRYVRYERDEVLVWVTQQRSGRARASAPPPVEQARV